MIKFIKKNIDAIVLFFLIGFFIGDFLTSITYKSFRSSSGIYFYRYAGVIKLLFEALMILMIVYNYKRCSKTFWYLIAFTMSFTISQFLLDTSSEYDIVSEMLNGNIYFFNRYMYLLIFILFIKAVGIKKETFQKTYRFFEYFLYLNAVAILLGFIFHLEIFRSYEYTQRFGVSGFFSKPGEASYMYMIAIIANYYLWIKQKKNSYLYKMLFFVACSLCLGQKKMLLFLILLGIIYLTHNNKYKKIFRIIIPITTVLLFIFKDTVIKVVLSKFPFWKNLYHENGLLTTLTSFRNVTLENLSVYIEEKWTFLNYFFGGLNFTKLKVEFEFIDLYAFMGIAGIIYYIFIIRKFFHKADFLKRSLIAIIFIISLLSGGLFLNTTAIILFYMVVKNIMLSDESTVHL